MEKFWTIEKIKELYQDVLYCKNNNLAIFNAFCDFSNKYNYSASSVRNYFYSHHNQNKQWLTDQQQISVNKSTPFSNEEISQLDEVCKLISSGNSVRKSCSIVGKTATQSTRLQNKLRWFKKNNMLDYSPRNVSIKNRVKNTPIIIQPNFLDNSNNVYSTNDIPSLKELTKLLKNKSISNNAIMQQRINKLEEICDALFKRVITLEDKLKK